jgi:hypothetical protein
LARVFLILKKDLEIVSVPHTSFSPWLLTRLPEFASFFTLKREDGLTTEALLERAANIYDETDTDSDTDTSGNNLDYDSVDSESDDASNDDNNSSSGNDLPEDKPDPYNSPSSTTTITFSHASIRDYLIRESNPTKQEFPSDLGIGVDITTAEKHIAITCLRVLTEEVKLPYREYNSDDEWSDESDDQSDENSNESSDDDGTGSEDSSDDADSEAGSAHSDEYVWDLEDYSADYFMEHFVHTKNSALTPNEKSSITRSLIKLVTDDVAVENWIDGTTSLRTFGKAWLGPGKYAEWVRGWLIDQMTRNEGYSDKEREITQSDQMLLKRFAVGCAERWLNEEDDDTDDEELIDFLDRFVPMVSQPHHFNNNPVYYEHLMHVVFL